MNSDKMQDRQPQKMGCQKANDNMPCVPEFRSSHVPTGLDLIKAVAIVFGVQFTAGFILGMYVDVGLGSALPETMLAAVLISNVCAFFVSWYFLCAKYDVPFAEGFAIRKVSLGTGLWSVAIGFFMAILAAVLMAFFSTGESEMAEITSTPEGFRVIAILLIVVPYFEEMYYRGFIFAVLRGYVGGIGAVILVTVWFGLLHVYQLAGDPIGILIVFVIGAILAIQRHVSKSLVPSIITHLVYNISILLLSLIGRFAAGSGGVV